MQFHRLTGIGVCIALLFGSLPAGRAQETRLTSITSGTGQKGLPKIYGDKIVWTDWRNDEAAIYMYDLSTKTESKIPVSKGSHTSQLDIYENRIVWSRGIWDAIMVYDLDTKTETEIAIRAKTPGHKANPAIYGDKVVWEDYRDGGSQIYMYDMASETETLISAIDHDPEQVNNGGDPDIYKNKIVWQGMSPDRGWDIYMYDLGPDGIKDTSDDGGERQITNARGAQAAPKVYGNVIVWMDKRNDEDSGIYLKSMSMPIVDTDNAESRDVGMPSKNNWDIYKYDLSTQEETQITSDPNFQGNPDIYGDIIIWMDSGKGCCDVYARDLNTQQEIAIAPDVRGQHIAIYEDTVVMGNAGRLIFVAKIPVPIAK